MAPQKTRLTDEKNSYSYKMLEILLVAVFSFSPVLSEI